MALTEDILAELKREAFDNAVRLFADACLLYRHRRHPSAYALAVLAYEELGKTLSVDRLCDAMLLNEEHAAEILEGRLASGVLTDHLFKQRAARFDTSMLDVVTKPPEAAFIHSGGLDRTKQQALYVELEDDEVLTPARVTREKAFGVLQEVLRAIKECGDVGFNGFMCDSTPLSEAQATEVRQLAESAFESAQNQVRAPSHRRITRS